jgi:tetratricopeptide (TPR) repeat protein
MIFEMAAQQLEEIHEQQRIAEALGIDYLSEHLELEQVYAALGTACIQAGDLERGERELRKALVLNPDYAEAHRDLGTLYREKGQPQVARRYYEKSLSLRPGNYRDRLEIARSFEQEGLTDEAARRARELVEAFPDRADAMVLLAATSLQGHDWREALRWTDLALEADPNHGYAWYHRGNALLLRDLQRPAGARGGGGEALEAFRNATRLLPRNFEAHYQTAAYLLGNEVYEAAKPYLVRAYELCRDDDRRVQIRRNLSAFADVDAAWYHGLAVIDSARDELDQAEAWLQSALAHDSGHVDSLLLLGRILRDRNRDEEALGYVRRACEVPERAFEAWSALADHLAALKRTGEAIEAYEAALGAPVPARWSPGLAEAARGRIEARLEELRADRDLVGPRMDD